MSGMWISAGRPRKMKKPVIAGHSIEVRKGGLYVVPRNRKGKPMWDMAKYVGEAPTAELDPASLPVMENVETEYAETDVAVDSSEE